MTARPWLSKLTFCCGFVVGFCLCFIAICHFRGIPSAQWLHRLATLSTAPVADSDPAPRVTDPRDSPPLPSGWLLCWVVANRKVSYSRSFPCCSGIILPVSSTSDSTIPGVPFALDNSEELEKLRHKTMAAFDTFHRRYNRFLGAAGDARVVAVKLRPALSQIRRYSGPILGWGLRTCGGRSYMLSPHAALRLVKALRNRSFLEFVETVRVLAGDTDIKGGPSTFHTMFPGTGLNVIFLIS